jgi:succinyl-CoA synthetase alpha subunit
VGHRKRVAAADRRVHGRAFHGRDAGHELHAGTIVEGKEDTASEKIARLAEAGIVVAEEISEIPQIVKDRIGAKV